MTEGDKQLLFDFESGYITLDKFLGKFSANLKEDIDFIRTEIQTAIESNDHNQIEDAITLMYFFTERGKLIPQFNELLITPNHMSHQRIAKTLQDSYPSPTTIPFIRKALESNFDYLKYTSSTDEVIAKWFSHLLAAIGTTEAINVIREYGNSTNEGIKREMLYRLKKIETSEQPNPTSIKWTIDSAIDNALNAE